MLRATCHTFLALAVALTANAMLSPTASAADRSAGGTLSDCPSCQKGAHLSGGCPECGRLGLGGRTGSRYVVAERHIDSHNPELFYNYYVPPNFGGGGALMYSAPGLVPGHVGHSYYTYQPLYPHEYLYKRTRTYHRYYNCGQGLNRTKVQWLAPPRLDDNALLNLFRLPR